MRLPAWVYNNSELTRLEMQQRVLLPSWQLVCHVNSIPRTGRFRNLWTWVTRASSSFATAMAKFAPFTTCAAIAAPASLDGAGNCPATITCPYHGWTYRHDGSLIGMPVRDSFPGLERSEHGLRPVRVDRAFGFVFVCLAGDPPRVSETWGKFADEFTPYRTDGNGPARTHHTRTLAGGLENRHGQLPRVLSRANRPSRTQPHVHTRL